MKSMIAGGRRVFETYGQSKFSFHRYLHIGQPGDMQQSTRPAFLRFEALFSKAVLDASYKNEISTKSRQRGISLCGILMLPSS